MESNSGHVTDERMTFVTFDAGKKAKTSVGTCNEYGEEEEFASDAMVAHIDAHAAGLTAGTSSPAAVMSTTVPTPLNGICPLMPAIFPFAHVGVLFGGTISHVCMTPRRHLVSSMS